MDFSLKVLQLKTANTVTIRLKGILLYALPTLYHTTVYQALQGHSEMLNLTIRFSAICAT